MAIRQGDLMPGDRVSVDSYISALPGRLPHTKGKEKPKQKYNGGTIFCDHASGVLFLVNQVSLRAGETCQAKLRFEQWARSHNVPRIAGYRADNVPFSQGAFIDNVRLQGQSMEYSGANAHHQNAVAERSIQTVTNWARTMLLHCAIHWPDQADLTLWPFAMEHAVYIWNHLPRRDSRLSPLEIFSQTRADSHASIERLHVWGCPTYVLDAELANGKKIPKWAPRSRRGLYLGYSPDHSSTVSRVLNLRTGHVSPQYHIVCDDHFSTVPVQEGGQLIDPDSFNPDVWARLIETGYELHLDVVELRDDDGNLHLPPLNDDWLTDDERRLRRQRHAAIQARNRMRARQVRIQHPHPPNPGGNGNPDQAAPPPPLQIHDPFQLVENPPAPHVPPPAVHDDDSDDSEFVPGPAEDAEDQPQAPEGVPNPPPPQPTNRTRRQRRRRQFHGGDDEWQLSAMSRKFRYAELNNQFLACLNWTKTVDALKSPNLARLWSSCLAEQDFDLETFEWLHPLLLSTKANAEDNPSWDEAMNGPLADGYMKAAETEIETLEQMDVWDVVAREGWMNVIPGTWAFRCKRFPDGSVRKLKGRFCVRGDKQIDGVDFD
ncbi:MAG: hypothetical protein ACX936_21195, partial [Marinobacter sp.]